MSEPMTIERLQAMLDRSPLIKFMGMRVTAIEAENQSVTIAMKLRPELERGPDTGQWHGGAIASLVDVAGDFALAVSLGAAVPTINFRVDYLRPAVNRTMLKARAWVRRAGRTIGVVDIDVEDEEGRLVAVGRGCYSMTPG